MICSQVLYAKPSCLSPQKAAFCSVKEALEVDWSSDKAKAALKRTASDYFLLQGEGCGGLPRVCRPGRLPPSLALEAA